MLETAGMKPTNKPECGVLVVQAGGGIGGYYCVLEQGHTGGHTAWCVQPPVPHTEGKR